MANNFNGGMQYQDWLKTLTEEEYEQHQLEKKMRKTNKKVWEALLEEKQAVLSAALFNALIGQLEKANNKNDTQAFIAARDSIVGKPKDEVVIEESVQPMEWNDDFDE